MGSYGLGSQAQEGSQDPRLRWQDGLIRCCQIWLWLFYGIMIMKFSFMCICIVFLVSLFVLHWRWSFYFQTHSSRWNPPQISPLILASFLGFTSLLFRFEISGVLSLAVHHLSCPFIFVQSLQIAARLRGMLDFTLHIFCGSIHSFPSHL